VDEGEHVEPVEIEFCTCDGRIVDALLLDCPPVLQGAVRPVVVLFSAAGMPLEDNLHGGAMRPWADWYRMRGLRSITIAIDMAGTTELEQYATAQAVTQYAREQLEVANEFILLHGLGFGAAMASAAALHNAGVLCAVDTSFVNASELCEAPYQDIGRSVLPKTLWLRKRIELGPAVGEPPRGESDARLSGYVTDLFNNEYKALKFKGAYCVLANTADDTMRPDYAARLFEAHYASREGDLEQRRSQCLIHFHSGRSRSRCFRDDPVAETRFAEFLYANGLSHPSWNVPTTLIHKPHGQLS